MEKKLVAVRIGNGTKIHAGYEFDTKSLSVGCSAVRHGGQLKRKVSENMDHVTCEKCRERHGLNVTKQEEAQGIQEIQNYLMEGRKVIGSSEGKKATKAQLRKWGVL